MSRYISVEMRSMVASRAGFKCEYCKIPENDSFFSFEIDHIISLKHKGSTILENLAYSCFPCNNNKGSDVGSVLFPDRSFIRLFDPRNDIWDDHFKFENGVMFSKTPVGEVTVELLKINDVERIIERRLMI